MILRISAEVPERSGIGRWRSVPGIDGDDGAAMRAGGGHDDGAGDDEGFLVGRAPRWVLPAQHAAAMTGREAGSAPTTAATTVSTSSERTDFFHGVGACDDFDACAEKGVREGRGDFRRGGRGWICR